MSGEVDTLRPRLDQHVETKDFWTRLVAFSSKDLNLNKAHIRYLESRLVALAQQSKAWTIENANAPQPANLSDADTAGRHWSVTTSNSVCVSTSQSPLTAISKTTI